eukprot:TRINITY_DN16266_c0_g1_i3.p1 TRINITY_DN16266_c0_g1~~TRINITY_DN16266_c0_g1_i3.p1  ORF type:complete len:778 (-),score=153.24 TRINITY_DN16266_c0_g1_i3:294-2627(-)
MCIRDRMKQPLHVHASGLCGNPYPGAGGHVNDSNWVGGKGYNGLAESYVYWLNGFIPMSVQLGDQTALAEIRSQMDGIFERAERNGGWLGPLVDGSPWSSFRFFTCLAQYFEASGDPRVSTVMFKYTHVLHNFLQATPLVVGSWSQVRWQEMVTACEWLVDTFGPRASASDLESTAALMELLVAQGFNWTGWVASSEELPWVNASWTPGHKIVPTAYREHQDISGGDLSSFQLSSAGTHLDCEGRCNVTAGCVAYVFAPAGCAPEKLPAPTCWLKASIEGVSENNCRNYRVLGDNHVKSSIKGWFPTNTYDADMIGQNKWQPKMDRMWTHGVNLAQAMATWSAMYRLTGDSEHIAAGKQAWEKVLKYHGQVTGVFTGDETLAGLPPSRGTETCTVVEMMNSAAEMFLTTGDVYYADLLEKIALNALPAAFMNGTMWSLNYFQQVNKLDAIDGCESGCTYCFGMVYECCVSNHVQGWPKFIARQFALVGQAGLALVHYFDSTSQFNLGGVNKVSIQLQTGYPFEESVQISCSSAASFELGVRIPGWCGSASITLPNGTVLGQLPAGTVYTVELPEGASTLTLTLPMSVRVVRRPEYLLNETVSVDTNAANVLRGPVVYAISRDFQLDHSSPYDEGPQLQPVGQPHGQDNYLLGTGDWAYALRVANDSAPGVDLVYVPTTPAVPPKGQGPFSAFLSPGFIKAKAQLVPSWNYISSEYDGARGAPRTCESGTSIKNYTAVWAGMPPKSPVPGVSTPLIDVMLLPIGATDLRVAEFPTTLP